MSRSIEHYRLPREASALDRVTLAIWRRWTTVARPALGAAALVLAAQLVVSWAVGLPTEDANSTPFRYLVRWASHPTPPLVSGGVGGDFGPSVLWWSVAAAFAMALVGAAASLPVLRRVRRSILVGTLSGAIVAAAHVTIAGLWTLRPLGYLGTAAIAFFADPPVQDVQVYTGSAAQNSIAVVALWSPVILGALLGYLTRRHRSEHRG